MQKPARCCPTPVPRRCPSAHLPHALLGSPWWAQVLIKVDGSRNGCRLSPRLESCGSLREREGVQGTARCHCCQRGSRARGGGGGLLRDAPYPALQMRVHSQLTVSSLGEWHCPFRMGRARQTLKRCLWGHLGTVRGLRVGTAPCPVPNPPHTVTSHSRAHSCPGRSSRLLQGAGCPHWGISGPHGCGRCCTHPLVTVAYVGGGLLRCGACTSSSPL